jgi:hypothetical protein
MTPYQQAVALNHARKQIGDAGYKVTSPLAIFGNLVIADIEPPTVKRGGRSWSVKIGWGYGGQAFVSVRVMQ